MFSHIERFAESNAKTMTMKAILPIVLLSVLVGCASPPSPQTEATSRVRPIVTALQAYHRDTGDYPQQLGELHPRYARADVPFDHSDENHIWRIFYQRVDRNNYALRFNTPPCSEAVYKNGTFIAAYGPAFK
jgi:hypothetical protein